MMIQSDTIFRQLTEKAAQHSHDRSRHLLCPQCRIRTKLYALKDGRKKCTKCGKKFRPEKKTDAVKLRQHADLLLCFCLNLTAKKASAETGYHYRLVSAVYDQFRMVLASQNLNPEKIRLLTMPEECDHGIHDSSFCRRCRGNLSCHGRQTGDSRAFGVTMLPNNQVFIEPLRDDGPAFRYDRPTDDSKGKFSEYAGFICNGSFHRFADNVPKKDGAACVWAWMHERLQEHHGIWKRNTGLYLKELEWKYNNRLLPTESQARRLAGLMPEDLLLSVTHPDKIRLDLVQKSE